MNGISPIQYPRRVHRIVQAVSMLVLGLNLVEYVLAWLGVLYGWLIVNQVVDFLPSNSPLPFLQPLRLVLVLPTLIAAHLGLIVAIVVARAIAFLAPTITQGNNGLWMHTWLGRRFVADKSIKGVHSVEMANERFLVWVDARKGLPLQNFLALLLFRRWSWSGFMITSDLIGFDGVAGRVFQQLKQNVGEEELHARYSEGKPSPQLDMLTQPLQVAREAGRADHNPLTRRDAGLQMASVAGSLALPLLVAAFIHLQAPWGAIVVPLAAMLEWPLAAAFIFAIGENYTRRISFDEALRLYPLTQLPRWGIALGLTVLVAAGWPWLLYVPALIPAVALSCMTVIRLVEGIFNLEFPSSLIGVIVTLIYQAIVYGLFLVFLPR